MARKIGFAVGLELAKRSPGKHCDINSELSSLSRRLNLGKVILREWDPVVFVTHTDSKAENLEAAFGEGVLEGIVQARSGRRVFVKHSIPPSERKSSTRLQEKSRGLQKT
jgi:hypothetical protein